MVRKLRIELIRKLQMIFLSDLNVSVDVNNPMKIKDGSLYIKTTELCNLV